jgi:hypothetical protein
MRFVKSRKVDFLQEKVNSFGGINSSLPGKNGMFLRYFFDWKKEVVNFGCGQ